MAARSSFEPPFQPLCTPVPATGGLVLSPICVTITRLGHDHTWLPLSVSTLLTSGHDTGARVRLLFPEMMPKASQLDPHNSLGVGVGVSTAIVLMAQGTGTGGPEK